MGLPFADEVGRRLDGLHRLNGLSRGVCPRMIFSWPLSWFTRDVGVDLGTANTLVYVRREGIVLREPSVVARRVDGGEVLAVGDEAKKMIGRTPGFIVATRPLRHGVIADFDTTASMLAWFIRRGSRGRSLIRPQVIV